MKKHRLLIALAVVALLPGCSEVEFGSHVAKRLNPPGQNEGTFKVGNPYTVEGETYYPREQYQYSETGIASWYGPGFDGHHTANGEIYDSGELTAAHRTLQMPSLVRVTNLDNGRSVIVRVNDRGPYKRGRIMDVSSKAADLLGMKGAGTAKVRLDLLPQESMQIAAAARSGLSTKGYEVAANNGTYAIRQGSVYGAPVSSYQVASIGNAVPVPQPAPVAYGQDYPVDTSAALKPVARETVASVQTAPAPQTGVATAVPGHTRYGQFYPDPVVTEMPVQATNIYVQAGAFASPDNANALSARMAAFGASRVEQALVNGQQFYRVRVGPAATVQEADRLLNRIVKGGVPGARIIVE
jgi:rare lipoprotein A